MWVTDYSFNGCVMCPSYSYTCTLGNQCCCFQTTTNCLIFFAALIALLQPTVVKTTKEEPLDGDVESKKERYELQSRSSVVLSDLAHVSDNALRIADHGGIRPLVALLHTDVSCCDVEAWFTRSLRHKVRLLYQGFNLGLITYYALLSSRGVYVHF